MDEGERPAGLDTGGLVRGSSGSEGAEICSASDLTFESDYSEDFTASEQDEEGEEGDEEGEGEGEGEDAEEDMGEEFLAVLSALNHKGPGAFVRDLQQEHSDPRPVLAQFNVRLPQMHNLDDASLWNVLERVLFRHYYCRQKIDTDFRQLVHTLQRSKNIVIVIGAGVSVSCGIPDFRSPKTGLYAHIKTRFPFLAAPEELFDLSLFREHPSPFFEIAKELISNNLRPSPTHHFLKWLESEGRLLRVYTQNIDTLEDEVGLQRVCYCHGSFKSSTCLTCGQAYTIDELRDFLAEMPVPRCSCSGVIKPDIVFFGESLPDRFDVCLAHDLDKADCFVVMGSSMKVHPVSMIPDLLPPGVPQFLINKTPIHDHNYDLQLLGDCDAITSLVKDCMLGGTVDSIVNNIADSIPESDGWVLFPGAELGDRQTDSEACESDLTTGGDPLQPGIDAAVQ